MITRSLALAVLAAVLTGCAWGMWGIDLTERFPQEAAAAREDLLAQHRDFIERVEAYSGRCPLWIQCSEAEVAAGDCHKGRMYKPGTDAEECYAEGLTFGEEAKSLAARWDFVQCLNMLGNTNILDDALLQVSAHEVAECWGKFYRHGD